jgi:hypothetical protein
VQSIEGTTVTFVDGTNAEFTAKQLEYIVTDEPKDLTQFRDLTNYRMVEEIIEVLKAHNMKK